MGAWGHLAFDNDDANDWAYDLKECDDLSLVESAIESVESSDDYLESPDAANALAACEVLARLAGNFGYQNAYTEKVDEWVGKHQIKPETSLVNRADAAIDRILGEDSELKELWKETDDYQPWLESVEDLRRRLK